MVDMYFYHDHEEQEKDQEEAALEDRKAVTIGAGEEEFTADAGEWGTDATVPAATGGEDWGTAGGEWGATTAGESWDAVGA